MGAQSSDETGKGRGGQVGGLRFPEELDRRFRAQVEAIGKKADGTKMTVTAALEEAIRAWLGQSESGAMFLSTPERALFDKLRGLTKTEPEIVEAVRSLVDVAESDPDLAWTAAAVIRTLEEVQRGRASAGSPPPKAQPRGG